MAPAPAVEEAAKRFGERSELCLGLHVTLNSEWPNYRWGPVSRVEAVPSLVEPDGFFYPNPWRLREGVHYRVEEVELEMAAQLNKLRRMGLQVRYMDSHMAVLKTRPDLWEAGMRFAAREGLVWVDGMETMSHGPYGPDLASDLERWKRLLAAYHQPRLAIFHPAESDAILEALGAEPPILPARQAESRLLASPQFTLLLASHGIESGRLDRLGCR